MNPRFKIWFKKIWSDSVWSKIIAGAIVSSCVAIFPSVRKITEEFLLSNLPVWVILLTTVLVFSIYKIRGRLRKPKEKFLVYDDTLRELDKTLFNDFRTNFLTILIISLLRENNFANSFNYNHLRELDNVYAYKDDVSAEFFSVELEALRTQIIKDILDFLYITGVNTFPLDIDTQAIPRDWAITDPKRFKDAVNAIHACRDSLCTNYDKLIRLGRNHLKL